MARAVVTGNAHHHLAAHEVVLVMETDASAGLSEREATGRLARYGPNALPAAATSGALLRLARQLQHPLIYVLLAAGVITEVLAEHVEAGVIFGVVAMNALVGYVQESKAEAVLDALREMVHTDAQVVRDGRVRRLPSEQLVPGDLVLLDTGSKVPADLRLVRVAELAVDESALTGESLPVAKDEVVLPEGTPVADRQNMVYSGTLVTAGTGAGIAVATGAETELGEIHRLVGTTDSLETPLTRKLDRFSKVLTVAILALAAVAFVAGVLRGEPATEMFTAAIALAVGAIPEGLPAVVTVTLAIGVARMARRRAVIRRLPAVETLGSTTVICTDKTGTLTENQMTVRSIWTPDDLVSVSGTGYALEGELRDREHHPIGEADSQALRWSLIAGAACNDAALQREDGRLRVLGDPTEGALLAVAAKAGLGRERVDALLPRRATIPFSSERQYMATLHSDPAGPAPVVLAKGGVERILRLCGGQMARDGTERPLQHERVAATAAALAAEGLRVLATAVGRAAAPGAFVEDSLEGTLVLTGLQAMQDPPRPSVAAAIDACHTAGIDVKMITGDHLATAMAIGHQIGLVARPDGEAGLTGADLDRLPADRYAEAVDEAAVFARVSPEQKLRLVEALQARHHVVAMTGDGVNDAPALRQADIGVAMGHGGTEVAKEAADMVLTDDDFATIEAAVEEGRGVFDNLTKFIVWTLPTNMGEGMVILVSILLGISLPILPVQILWINMTTAVFLGLMLAFEPKEPELMRRPPRDPRRPLLTVDLVLRVLLVSALLVAGAWLLFQWERSDGATLAAARSAALNFFVVVEVLYLFSSRSLTRSFLHVGVFSNAWIYVGVGVQVAGQLLLTYLPTMNRLFRTAPVPLGTWVRILLLGLAAALVVALDKRIRRALLRRAAR